MKKHITVFCSSSNNISPSYLLLGAQVGEALGKAHWNLVYGGGQNGIMGEVARATKATGGDVIGIIPNALIESENPYLEATKIYYVDSLAERKKRMIEYADAFILLPGGIGTLDEMFEVLTLKMIGLTDKPCLVFNSGNFFGPLLNFIAFLAREKFIYKYPDTLFQVCSSLEEVMDNLPG